MLAPADHDQLHALGEHDDQAAGGEELEAAQHHEPDLAEDYERGYEAAPWLSAAASPELAPSPAGEDEQAQGEPLPGTEDDNDVTLAQEPMPEDDEPGVERPALIQIFPAFQRDRTVPGAGSVRAPTAHAVGQAAHETSSSG